MWNKEELTEKWKELIIAPIYETGDKTDCSNYRGMSLLSITYKILSNILLSRLMPYVEEIIGGSSVQNLTKTGQLIIIYSAFIKCLTENRNKISYL
jgi:hypothetical protein